MESLLNEEDIEDNWDENTDRRPDRVNKNNLSPREIGERETKTTIGTITTIIKQGITTTGAIMTKMNQGTTITGTDTTKTGQGATTKGTIG